MRVYRSLARSLALVLAATLALSGGCRLAGPDMPAPVRTPAMPGEEPKLRVGVLVDVAEVVVSSEQGLEILEVGGDRLASGRAGEVWRIAPDGAGGLVAVPGEGETLGPVPGPLLVRPAGQGTVRLGDRSYHGTGLVSAVGLNRVTAVNEVQLEAYLAGVVPSEMPSLELEALKAQAVAARTYAVRNLNRRDALGFDLFATVADQVYGGVDREAPMATQAIRETRGQILVHRGMPIEAYYHSTCGGHTANVEDIWGGQALPYLRGVSDRIPGTDRFYCQESSRFIWTESWSNEALAGILSRSLSDHSGASVTLTQVQDVTVAGRTPHARVAVLRVVADGRTFDVQGDSIRWVLRPEASRGLNSTNFSLSQRRNGSIRTLAAGGTGWGHGVGMCQWGAIGRARAGMRYDEILAAYYKGARISRLY